MSAVTTYTCNICRKEIKRTDIYPGGQSGIALRWAMSEQNTLEFHSDWNSCPLHVCWRCIETLDVLIQQIKEKKEMT